ncbi:Tobamovirus multiplication protein 2A [Linum grandiflorum]
MACRGFWECLLKLLNFLLAVAGLAMVGYGIYLFVEYKHATDDVTFPPSSSPDSLIQLGRPMLMAVSLSESIFDKLPKPWFIYLFIGVGVVLFVVSCCGCIGAVTRNGCCLSCVSSSYTSFIFFDKSWQEVSVVTIRYSNSVLSQLWYLTCDVISVLQQLPVDKTGNFDMVYGFLKENWEIVKWVALGVVVFQALIFVLALVVRAVNRPVEYDSDDELIAPRQQIRQPLMNRPPLPPATGVPVAGTLDQRPSRNDAWSTRMREKYGLDTAEFTYNPSESHRYQQVSAQPTEERSRCTIM